MRHQQVLDTLAERLLEDETIEGVDLEQIFQSSSPTDGLLTPLTDHRHRLGAPNLVPLPRIAQVASMSLPPAE
jgi:hypothetical protein